MPTETTAPYDSEPLVDWLRRIAKAPEMRVRGGAHVECQPGMLEDAANELERQSYRIAALESSCEVWARECGRNAASD